MLRLLCVLPVSKMCLDAEEPSVPIAYGYIYIKSVIPVDVVCVRVQITLDDTRTCYSTLGALPAQPRPAAPHYSLPHVV